MRTFGRGIPLTLLLLFCASAALGQDARPRVVRIEPARADGLLVCSLHTADLPGERILSTLASGLESAIEIRVRVLGARDEMRRDYELRLAFDLWEEFYAVRLADQQLRFADADELRVWLSALPPLAIAQLSELGEGPLRLEAGLVLHPLAPAARGRVQEMVAGDGAVRPREDGGQEASVSMGRLIRFFYRGGSDDDAIGRFTSASFTIRELNHVPD